MILNPPSFLQVSFTPSLLSKAVPGRSGQNEPLPPVLFSCLNLDHDIYQDLACVSFTWVCVLPLLPWEPEGQGPRSEQFTAEVLLGRHQSMFAEMNELGAGQGCLLPSFCFSFPQVAARSIPSLKQVGTVMDVSPGRAVLRGRLFCPKEETIPSSKESFPATPRVCSARQGEAR